MLPSQAAGRLWVGLGLEDLKALSGPHSQRAVVAYKSSMELWLSASWAFLTNSPLFLGHRGHLNGLTSAPLLLKSPVPSLPGGSYWNVSSVNTALFVSSLMDHGTAQYMLGAQ